MAKKVSQSSGEQVKSEQESKPEAVGLEAKHGELLAKCEESGVKGVNWLELLQQYGPMFLQALLQILQRTQPVAMKATAEEGNKVHCSPEQLKCLDDCIEQQTACLCKLLEHRCHCEVTGG